jgi:glycosyltransferase involved in cell wall biosynthesis
VRLLFVADGRSPIAVNWIRHFVDLGHEIHLVTTFVSNPPLELASITHLPVAFSGLKSADSVKRIRGALDGAGKIRLRTMIRNWLGPYTLSPPARKLSAIARKLEPDLIHAMRIPFEGMLAAQADLKSPLLTSVWGNDFTLHGLSTRKMRSLTKVTLQKTTGLHVDCNRDLRLALEWGYPQDQPAIVLPGAGGIVPEIFHSSRNGVESRHLTIQGLTLDIPSASPVVVNPRGFRAYVRNDTFFQSIPTILEKHEDTIFLCPTMEGIREAEEWVKALGIEDSVHLLPRLTSSEMGEVYRRSLISVSPSEHDGTPNTLLESMACGCFPIAGDIESIREWIQDGTTGLLVNPAEPTELAEAVVSALRQPEFLDSARAVNIDLVHDRARRSEVMRRAELFYQELL